MVVDFTVTARSVGWELITIWCFEPVRFKPIKLAYDN